MVRERGVGHASSPSLDGCVPLEAEDGRGDEERERERERRMFGGLHRSAREPPAGPTAGASPYRWLP